MCSHELSSQELLADLADRQFSPHEQGDDITLVVANAHEEDAAVQNTDMPVPGLSLEPEIRRYYEAGREAGRLEDPVSRWEKVRTLDLLRRFLPPAPAVVLDVGGAAGVYAFPLAAMGYIVDLI